MTPAKKSIRTTCAYCGVGCGVLATPDGQGGLAIAGDPTHPASHGRLCSKGSALGETVSHEGRLTTPLLLGEPVSWTAATGLIADRFAETISRHGPDSVALYVSGQLLTEDYYVANKFAKGFLGTANIDTNSRLCMASSVAGHRRAFGTDTVPGQYTDLEQADLVVLVGSNLAWCHPVLYQRLAAAKASRPAMRVVVVDPRRTATCDLADLHVPVAPGGDVALFNHLLAEIAKRGAVDDRYVAAHIQGLDAALTAARGDDPRATGLSDATLSAFADLWVGTRKVVTVYSQGVNQSVSGTDKVNAIINCHLATGRIGRPGMGPLSVTGQPNAMGGREVGGLANMLAAHLDLEDAGHRDAVRRFWNAPAMPTGQGLKAVEMFRAVADGRVRALWIMCTNPAVSMPEADAVRAAIEGCDFTVVSDLSATTDTARCADLVLPATGWGEKSGTVTNSERCISRQRRAVAPPPGARDDWRIIADVARSMGWGEAFAYDGPASIFREHAALSGIAGDLGRDFDISDLADLTDAAYEALAPVTWPVAKGRRGGRFFGDGGFYTPDGRGRMLPVSSRPVATPLSKDYPLRLNTGRVRDHWHTMTRTGRSARLSSHLAEPFVEIHPADARDRGLSPADLALVESPHGRAILRVIVTDRIAPGQVFAPMHWTGETASLGRIDALVPACTDPVSGQPESKAAPVAMRRFEADWYGFAVSADAMAPGTEYWALARAATGWRAELADRATPSAGWEDFAARLFGMPDATAISVRDAAGGLARVALMRDGRVVAALFTAREPVAVARAHVVSLIGGDSAPEILAGRAGADRPDPGQTICACFSVGANTIIAAIREGRALSVKAVGEALGAGTNCGSCKPEIAAMLEAHRIREAAE